MKKFPVLLVTFIFSLVFSSCEYENPETVMGSVELSIDLGGNSSGKVHQDDAVSSVIISIESESGDIVLDEEEYNVNGYTSDPILLEVGAYKLTKFLVLNEASEVIYATPLIGSILENLVSTPLPQEFAVSADEVSNLSLEVISTASLDPENLGYSNLAFSITPTSDVLVSVLSQVGNQTSFVESTITVFGDADSLMTINLGDSINVVKLRTSYDQTTLVVTYDGTQLTKTLTSDEIDYHRTVPILFTFSSTGEIDLKSGLLVYYPFNGDADDLSGNDYHGVLGDGSGNNLPTLTSDRNGNADLAYQFDGVDDYIDLGERSIFDVANYDEFTMALWVKPDEGAKGSIFSKYISASNNRMWQIRSLNGTIGYHTYNNGVQYEVDSVITESSTNWQHIAVTFKDNQFSIYRNGTFVSKAPYKVNTISSSSTAKTLIGGVHYSVKLFDALFEGAVDEVYMYTRAMSVSEIEALMNQD